VKKLNGQRGGEIAICGTEHKQCHKMVVRGDENNEKVGLSFYVVRNPVGGGGRDQTIQAEHICNENSHKVVKNSTRERTVVCERR